jgi:hypothetical protein
MEEENHILDSLVEQEREIETYFTKKYCRLLLCNACILSASLFCIVYIYYSQT